MQVKVCELIVRYMERIGVETIFGMPGAHILPVYDRLYDSSIQSVLVKHEQGAAFMAGGFARASGKIGACITTAGPGATNLVTGIANAYADKLPVLVITGEAPTYVFGKGGLQESSGEGGSIDQGKLFAGISRYHKIIERTDYLGNVLNNISKILFSATSGPVILSLPFNIQNETVDDAILDTIKTCGKPATCQADDSDMQIFANYLIAAEKPVIICGYGCIKSGAQTLVRQLSEQLNIPVTSSLKGKGSIDETSSHSLGSLGVTSSGYACEYMTQQADLIIILGAAFNERTSYLWDKTLLKAKKIIQVDINEQQLEKVYLADLVIHADIKQTLLALQATLQTFNPVKKQLDNLPEFKHQQQQQADQSGHRIFNDDFGLIRHFYHLLNTRITENAIIVDDNIIFAQNFFQVLASIQYLPNSGISSLGHAIPAAIGAQFAEQKTAFVIIGDGGFQMCCMELMTAVNYNIPLNVIIINNNTMGLIRKNQVQTYQQRFINCDFINPDYALLAKSFGIHYFHIKDENASKDFFAQADLKKAINLIEIPLDKNAFPNYSSRR